MNNRILASATLLIFGALLIFIDFVLPTSFAKLVVSIPPIIGGVWCAVLIISPKLLDRILAN